MYDAIIDGRYSTKLPGAEAKFTANIHTKRGFGSAFITLKNAAPGSSDDISLTFKASLMDQKKLPDTRFFDNPHNMIIFGQITYTEVYISKGQDTIYNFDRRSLHGGLDKVFRNMTLLWRILHSDAHPDLEFKPVPSGLDTLSLLIIRDLNQPDEMLQQTLELDILLPILPYMQQIDFDFTLLPINQIYVRHNLPKTTKYKNERLEFPAGATLEYALRLIHELEPYYTAERMPEIIEEQAKYARGQLALQEYLRARGAAQNPQG